MTKGKYSGYWVGFDGSKWQVFHWTSDSPPTDETGYMAWGGPYPEEEAKHYCNMWNG